ncbi:hypothetical protein Vretimale_18186 [Volvox reticuliferus]|uniref:Uncharacterized protein n=2 Tax=Volvox reticuliferus TaxID=1737510 RepID=A0A8J4GWF2_9CHLO|nr:hypothetical protein Vretifemale_17958 [Volvox reticuliferus]GIM15405.1 hypothetical protein Vretimale_18186 [Volvox reticuliferus]
MGPLRQYFENGDLRACAAHIEALWVGRHQNKSFEASDAEDAAWLLDTTQGSPAFQQQFWPKLLVLLTRWAFLAGRADPLGPADSTDRNQPFLLALQRRLAARLTLGPLPWAVRAPTLLLIAVVGCSTASNAAAPLQLACQALHSEMLMLVRRPSADILNSRDAVTDFCTAVELVLERLVVKGDWRGAASIFVALLAAMSSALDDLCTHIAAETVTRSLPPLPLAGSQPPHVPGGAGNRPHIVSAAAIAAAQENAAAALAALQASCRTVGSTCARAVATAATGPSTSSVVVHAAASATGTTAPDFRNPSDTVGRDDSRPVAAAVLTAVRAIAENVHATAAAIAAAGVAAEGVEDGVSLHIRMLARPVENRQFGRNGGREGTVAGGITTGAKGEWWTSAAPAAPLRSETDPWAMLAVVATAASGLLEGFVVTVRQQPLGRPQELLQRLLHPSADQLASALKAVAGATAAAAARMTSDARGSLPASPGTGTEPAAVLGGRCSSACALGADSRFTILSMAVGYSWVRLRAHAQLPGPDQLAAHAVEQMAAAAVATSPAAAEGSYGSFWHPARGALTVLMVASLGVGRVMQMACAGAHADAAFELLEGHSRCPLYSDAQLLAKSVIESLRAPASAPARAPISVPMLATATPLATALLSDAATAAQRLHLLYGGVADTAAGRAWLAALSSSSAGRLRELLDRVFVCAVSVLAGVRESLTPAPTAWLPLPKPGAAHPPGDAIVAATVNKAAQGSQVEGQAVQLAADARAATAVMALGALADLQFCALQLRAHGDLVPRLSADAAAVPAAAVWPLLALLPCYPAFAAAYHSNGGGSSGGFAAVPVAASRLAFLVPLAASCVPHAEDVGDAACGVLPYIYLLFKGAPESVVQAAHSTWAALLAGLSEERDAVQAPSAVCGRANGGGAQGQRGPLSPGRGCGGATEGVGGAEREAWLKERRDVRVAVAASMVPYYIDRTCEEPCSVGDLELLEWGLRQVLRSLPEAHPMKVWAAARLARQLCKWAGEWEDEGNAVEAYGGERHRQRGENRKVLVQHCAGVVGNVAMTIDFTLLPHMLDALTAELQVLKSEQAAVILQRLHDVWLICNDYGRKQYMEDWLMQVLVKVRVRTKF